MRSFWSDPYLWIHLAGAAALPIFLELCFVGLALGDPILPTGIEFLVVAAVGIAPILWMQWQRPFSIYSLLLLALKPSQLTEDQRKILQLFKAPENRTFAIATAIGLAVILWQLSQLTSLGANVAPFLPQSHLFGVLLAAIAFLGCNLFAQVPTSVLRVLLISDARFAKIKPYPAEKVGQDFTLLGWRVNQIVPPLTEDLAMAAATSPSGAMALPTPPPSPVAAGGMESPVLESPVLETPSVEEPVLESLEGSASQPLSATESDTNEPGVNEPDINEPDAVLIEPVGADLSEPDADAMIVEPLAEAVAVLDTAAVDEVIAPVEPVVTSVPLEAEVAAPDDEPPPAGEPTSEANPSNLPSNSAEQPADPSLMPPD